MSSSTLFLIISGILFIVVILLAIRYSKLRQRLIPQKQQLNLFQLREKYLNGILNIKELTLRDLRSQQKQLNTINKKMGKLPSQLKKNFNSIDITSTKLILDASLSEKEWEKNAQNIIERKALPPLSDILKLLRNAPKGCSEGEYACELRSIVQEQMKNKTSAARSSATISRYEPPQVKLKDQLDQINGINSRVDNKPIPLLAGNFAKLSLLKERAQSVGLVCPIHPEGIIEWNVASGFLITNRLLLTTHETLPSRETAHQYNIWLDYEENPDHKLTPFKPLTLDPDTFFLTSPELGFSVVAISETTLKLPNLSAAHNVDDPLLGTSLTVIHHAGGNTKQILNGNSVLHELSRNHFWFSGQNKLHMNGAPVFDENLNVIGMCVGTNTHVDKSLPDSHPNRFLNHQAIRYDRITQEIKSSMHKLKRAEQSYLREEAEISDFVQLG